MGEPELAEIRFTLQAADKRLNGTVQILIKKIEKWRAASEEARQSHKRILKELMPYELRRLEIEAKRDKLVSQVSHRTQWEMEKMQAEPAQPEADQARGATESKGAFEQRKANAMSHNMDAMIRLTHRVAAVQTELAEASKPVQSRKRSLLEAQTRLEEANEVLRVLKETLVEILLDAEDGTQEYLLDHSPEARALHIAATVAEPHLA